MLSYKDMSFSRLNTNPSKCSTFLYSIVIICNECVISKWATSSKFKLIGNTMWLFGKVIFSRPRTKYKMTVNFSFFNSFNDIPLRNDFRVITTPVNVTFSWHHWWCHRRRSVSGSVSGHWTVRTCSKSAVYTKFLNCQSSVGCLRVQGIERQRELSAEEKKSTYCFLSPSIIKILLDFQVIVCTWLKVRINFFGKNR